MKWLLTQFTSEAICSCGEEFVAMNNCKDAVKTKMSFNVCIYETG